MNTSPLEKTIVAQIVRALKAAGVGWIIKTHGGAFQGAGLPDILCIAPVPGRLLGVEVKRPKLGRLTERQKSQLARIEAAGVASPTSYRSNGDRRKAKCSSGEMTTNDSEVFFNLHCRAPHQLSRLGGETDERTLFTRTLWCYNAHRASDRCIHSRQSIRIYRGERDV